MSLIFSRSPRFDQIPTSLKYPLNTQWQLPARNFSRVNGQKSGSFNTQQVKCYRDTVFSCEIFRRNCIFK